MEMMLDALDRLCGKINYLKENWKITSEDLEDQDYYEKEAYEFLENNKLN